MTIKEYEFGCELDSQVVDLVNALIADEPLEQFGEAIVEVAQEFESKEEMIAFIVEDSHAAPPEIACLTWGTLLETFSTYSHIAAVFSSFN